MAVSAQALLDEAARLKERYPDADHMAMAEAVLAEREHGAQVATMLGALYEAREQIEYLHGMFQETGSGNGVIARINAAIQVARGGHQ